jgi:hypothetical protein
MVHLKAAIWPALRKLGNCRCQSSHVEMACWTGVQSNRAAASTIEALSNLGSEDKRAAGAG